MITPELNITLVPTYSTKTIGIVDITPYPTNYHIVNPTLEITPPGYSKISVIFNPSSVNIYNGNYLNMCLALDYSQLPDLPDGIWTIKYSVSPNSTTYTQKSFLKTDIIECKYARAFLKLDLTEQDLKIKDSKKSKLSHIRLFIDGAVSAANDCNYDLAIKLYQKASSLLDRYMNDECDDCK